MFFRIKVRAWWGRPMFMVRGIAEILDGLILLLSLGFIGSKFNYEILRQQMKLDFYLHKRLKKKAIVREE